MSLSSLYNHSKFKIVKFKLNVTKYIPLKIYYILVFILTHTSISMNIYGYFIIFNFHVPI